MIQRKLYRELQAHLSKKEYTILTGARQTGKSTLLRQLETDARAQNMPTVFLNLENKAILAELNESPLNVLKYLPDTTTDKKILVLIDEVQYHNDPSNLLKHLYDDHAHQVKIVATGSSAFYIDDKFRDSLTGRKKIFHLYTCTFEEYLELVGKQDLLEEAKRISGNKKAKSVYIDYLKNEWENYLIYGGYPAVITEHDKSGKIERLKEIRDSFVKRDILESGVANEIAFYSLFRILAAQTGSLVNINELATTLRIKNETVSSYITVMQKCFHIALIKPFFRNLRKELVKMPKLFMMDNGLRNSLLSNFQPLSIRPDKGELWENACFRALADKYALEDIRFWRTSTGNEVDFIITNEGSDKAIEIKYHQSQARPSKYKMFSEAYPEIPISFEWMHPFDEDFFRRMNALVV